MATRIQTRACRRLPDREIPWTRIPSGTKIIDCGSVYIAELSTGRAVVTVDSRTIEARSKLRRAAIAGRLTGTKRKRRRRR